MAGAVPCLPPIPGYMGLTGTRSVSATLGQRRLVTDESGIQEV